MKATPKNDQKLKPKSEVWQTTFNKYHPSGAGGTRTPPVTPDRLQNPKWTPWGPKMADRVQNPRLLAALINFC